MNNQNITQTVNNTFPVPSILTGIFIIMKIMGYFPYSWWWVFSPFWIPFLLAIILVLLK